MATPLPREHFDSEADYLRAFWITAEYGVHLEDYDMFKQWFEDGHCPMTDEEKKALAELPSSVTLYRGYSHLHPIKQRRNDRKCSDIPPLNVGRRLRLGVGRSRRSRPTTRP